MNKKQTIAINGVEYDAITGMRLGTEGNKQNSTEKAPSKTAPVRKQPLTAGAFHAHKTTRSKTLNRRYVKSPITKGKTVPTDSAGSLTKKAPRPAVNHQKSPMITKFAKPEKVQAQQPAKKHAVTITDIGPMPHPKVAALKKTVNQRSSSAADAPLPKPPTNSEIKKMAIEKALEKSIPGKKQPKKPRNKRMLNIASAGLMLVLITGYITYINMPSLSVKIAAAQSGIAATYPSFQPTGYSLKGPVAYENGKVTISFASNSNPQKFALNQSKSTWDSSALLDNYVQKASNGNYQIFNDSGLTVYVYGTNAAWVNGGVLHTITGDATLSSYQILHIATSM